ncbi:uncharacterized protein LOC120606817 isoform X2 [Pteropus medius]|uniref:uncharacterized protein LOC120606817 isoform X2 n=1 Tax=Pteropus vampyrus TaxID=132908 RepID=UPI00196BAB27|nr:uncharacterized protein LOC120606817 isoform X2 [Pteropus giganteus]
MGRERSLGCCAPAEPAWSRPRHRASVTLKLRVLVPLDLAAVAEPQEEDPLLWAWPGAQEAAQLPTPLGDAAKGHHGDPCLEAPGESPSWRRGHGRGAGDAVDFDPVTFQDVTVEFTQEEWEHLGTAQRALYCEGARIPSPMWSPSWSKVDLHGWRGGESLGASLQTKRLDLELKSQSEASNF